MTDKSLIGRDGKDHVPTKIGTYSKSEAILFTMECKHWACNKLNNTCVGCGAMICPVCLKESNSCKCENKDICCTNEII
jgi:hypothetical protein